MRLITNPMAVSWMKERTRQSLYPSPGPASGSGLWRGQLPQGSMSAGPSLRSRAAVRSQLTLHEPPGLRSDSLAKELFLTPLSLGSAVDEEHDSVCYALDLVEGVADDHDGEAQLLVQLSN